MGWGAGTQHRGGRFEILTCGSALGAASTGVLVALTDSSAKAHSTGTTDMLAAIWMAVLTSGAGPWVLPGLFGITVGVTATLAGPTNRWISPYRRA